MRLRTLGKLIEISLNSEPVQQIINLTGEYYQPYYNLFWHMAAYIQNGSIVELGVNRGIGLNAFAMGNPGGKIIGIDLNMKPDYTEPNVEFHLMSALPVPDFIPLKSIGALHIDTEHSYSNAKNEFWQYEPYLAPGAVVLFDDLHAMEDGVLRAFYELPFPKIQDDRLHPGNGYGVLIYEKS